MCKTIYNIVALVTILTLNTTLMLVVVVIFIIHIIFIYLPSFLQFVTKVEKREHSTAILKYLKRAVYNFSIYLYDWTSLFAILIDKCS